MGHELVTRTGETMKISFKCHGFHRSLTFLPHHEKVKIAMKIFEVQNLWSHGHAVLSMGHDIALKMH